MALVPKHGSQMVNCKRIDACAKCQLRDGESLTQVPNLVELQSSKL